METLRIAHAAEFLLADWSKHCASCPSTTISTSSVDILLALPLTATAGTLVWLQSHHLFSKWMEAKKAPVKTRANRVAPDIDFLRLRKSEYQIRTSKNLIRPIWSGERTPSAPYGLIISSQVQRLHARYVSRMNANRDRH
jgi:hypothetical protein